MPSPDAPHLTDEDPGSVPGTVSGKANDSASSGIRVECLKQRLLHAAMDRGGGAKEALLGDIRQIIETRMATEWDPIAAASLLHSNMLLALGEEFDFSGRSPEFMGALYMFDSRTQLISELGPKVVGKLSAWHLELMSGMPNTGTPSAYAPQLAALWYDLENPNVLLNLLNLLKCEPDDIAGLLPAARIGQLLFDSTFSESLFRELQVLNLREACNLDRETVKARLASAGYLQQAFAHLFNAWHVPERPALLEALEARFSGARETFKSFDYSYLQALSALPDSHLRAAGLDFFTEPLAIPDFLQSLGQVSADVVQRLAFAGFFPALIPGCKEVIWATGFLEIFEEYPNYIPESFAGAVFDVETYMTLNRQAKTQKPAHFFRFTIQNKTD
jgi:hypothetical protein